MAGSTPLKFWPQENDHPNLCKKSANKSVATRTVFTTQIWDITEITQPRLRTAEKQLRTWDRVDKKKVAAP